MKVLNDKLIVGGIFCDLQEAFDYVSRNILLSKLKFCEIAGKAIALLKSYLKNGYQSVIMCNADLNHNTFSR